MNGGCIYVGGLGVRSEGGMERRFYVPILCSDRVTYMSLACSSMVGLWDWISILV